MEVTTIKAETRTEIGTKKVKRLRSFGRVPCVVYGAGGESISLSLSADDVERELRLHHRVFHLEHSGVTDGVFLQDVQYHVITDKALHLDFRRIDLDKPIEVELDFTYVGRPAGETRGGVLTKDRISFLFHSLPHAIPLNIEIGIKDIDLGDAIRAKDLVLPEGVTLIEGTEETVIAHMPGGREEAPAAEEDGEAEA